MVDESTRYWRTAALEEQVGHLARFLKQFPWTSSVTVRESMGVAEEGRALQLSSEPIYSRILPAWAVTAAGPGDLRSY